MEKPRRAQGGPGNVWTGSPAGWRVSVARAGQPKAPHNPPLAPAHPHDPEGRSFAELLVDVVAAEVIEPWGGGKWHLEIFRSVNPEPEDWNGEM